MNYVELSAFVVYLLFVIGIGIFFFLKGRKSDGGDKDYFLGGRKMNGWVAALSAGASDMSAWVLMGLPGTIYMYGMGQVWISIGLLLGTTASWIFVAPRLRRFSIQANDSITIPQYLTNRFCSKNLILQVICASIFVIVYCIYAASSIYACGTLFNTVFQMDSTFAMVLATVIIILYTFLGGFHAVCWTDFFQGMLMLAALMAAPIAAVITMDLFSPAAIEKAAIGANYYNFLSSGSLDWESISDILTGIGWGLGYFGMPHILVRYMSIKSEKEMKKSRVIGISWTGLILFMATLVGIIGRYYIGATLPDKNLLFITMVRGIFPALIAGILLSAILAASMSTADSQLLLSSSAFTSDVYKPLLRKNASNKEMLWTSRCVVTAIAVIALIIAMDPDCSGIMGLVECAWGAFGSAFGPVILLSLFWKRFTYHGAICGITVGFAVDMVWYLLLSESTGLYEIVPGFFANLLVAIIISLLGKKPSAQVYALFDQAKEMKS